MGVVKYPVMITKLTKKIIDRQVLIPVQTKKGLSPQSRPYLIEKAVISKYGNEEEKASLIGNSGEPIRPKWQVIKKS